MNGTPEVTPGSSRAAVRNLLLFLVGTAVFALAYCQAPLYYSNQNQYFLHGLANGGVGFLHDDWLAQTKDPTPIFSALVAVVVRYLHPATFYLLYALLMGVYAWSLAGVFVSAVGPEVAKRRWLAFAALFLLVHAALPRWASYRWLGHDYPYYLQGGVAGQYILGAMFQPSNFGVLLVLATFLFIRNRVFLAGICVAVAGTIHTTYLLPGAFLTLGFLTSLLQQGRWLRTIQLGALTFALVLPVVLHLLFTFGPSSPEAFAQAQDILVNFRIPHHARPDLWLDRVAVLQVAWMVLALILLALTGARTPLLTVLGVPFVLSVLLTILQVVTGNQTLALLFPWRVSSVLMPLATTVILARLVAIPALPLERPVVRLVSGVVVVGLVAAGWWINVTRQAFYTNDDELGVMAFVEADHKPGDLYFLPVHVPDLVKTVRGSMSSDFKPLPDKKVDLAIIPMDFQRFRLHAGAPIYIDFKSIPYKDTEVITWRDRLEVARSIKDQIEKGEVTQAVPRLRDLGVTHVIVPTRPPLPEDGLERVYEDASYRVLRLTKGGQ